MGRQNSSKGQITIVTVPEATIYSLLPSATCITVDKEGNISDEKLTCKICKTMGSRNTTLAYGEDGTRITYTTFISGEESEEKAYVVEGIDTSKLYDKIRFYLYVDHGSIKYTNADVPIIKNGELDTNFQIWVGEIEGAPTKDIDPWKTWIAGGTEKEHVGDYYINSYFAYYEFVYRNGEYKWVEVTDNNLKKVLERTSEITAGYFVEGDPELFFADKQYKFGDLMLYNGNMYFCIEDMDTFHNKGFQWKDWLISSDVKAKLFDTGIDIENSTIEVTASNFKFKNNAGEYTAMISTESGYPKINASLIDIDADVLLRGKLTADKIEAGTLNSDVIYSGNISADLITSGKISADLIDASTIKVESIDASKITLNSSDLYDLMLAIQPDSATKLLGWYLVENYNGKGLCAIQLTNNGDLFNVLVLDLSHSSIYARTGLNASLIKTNGEIDESKINDALRSTFNSGSTAPYGSDKVDFPFYLAADGSGHIAKGAISWNKDGTLALGYDMDKTENGWSMSDNGLNFKKKSDMYEWDTSLWYNSLQGTFVNGELQNNKRYDFNYSANGVLIAKNDSTIKLLHGVGLQLSNTGKEMADEFPSNVLHVDGSVSLCNETIKLNSDGYVYDKDTDLYLEPYSGLLGEFKVVNGIICRKQ